MKNPELTGGTLLILIGACLILLAQGSWLFLDARKRGAFPWLWGIWGLINFPLPLIVYWFVVRWPQRRAKERRDD